MPYTLLKFLIWGAVFFLAGGLVGWLLRSLSCRAEVAAARRTTTDPDDVARMRHRLANLETVVDERDRLRTELDRATAAAADGAVDVAPAVTTTPAFEAAESPEGTAEPPAEAAESLEGTAEPAEPVAGTAEPAVESVELDLGAAAAVLGARIRRDDLTVIEGIGPKIAELCHAIGITTWDSLAATDAATLRSMLADAGARYQLHDPTSWPHQAGHLSRGEWEAFKALTDELDGGR